MPRKDWSHPVTIDGHTYGSKKEAILGVIEKAGGNIKKGSSNDVVAIAKLVGCD
jgi:hypothetical protein